jgi:hypothetical protein
MPRGGLEPPTFGSGVQRVYQFRHTGSPYRALNLLIYRRSSESSLVYRILFHFNFKLFNANR